MSFPCPSRWSCGVCGSEDMAFHESRSIASSDSIWRVAAERRRAGAFCFSRYRLTPHISGPTDYSGANEKPGILLYGGADIPVCRHRQECLCHPGGLSVPFSMLASEVDPIV